MNDQVVQDIEHITSSHVTSSSHHIHQNVSYHHHGSLVICPRITKCFQEIIMHSINYSSLDLLANKIHQQWSTQSDHHLNASYHISHNINTLSQTLSHWDLYNAKPLTTG